jgi:hypothetical protein
MVIASCKRFIHSKILTFTLPILLAAATFLSCYPAEAAVQMGGHMDIVLSNGRTIRLFPEALDSAPLRPGNILPSRQNVNTKPPGGDPCKKLEEEWDKRTGVKKEREQRAKPKPVEPRWLKSTPKLKNYRFMSTLYVNTKPTSWYYLPAEPRVSLKNSIPEATFVKFITDETTEAGGAEGGLFHLMVTYGLTKAEEEELNEALKDAVPGATLKGMVDLEPSKSSENFIVTSGTLSDDGFAPSGVLTSGRAPTFPGAKAAVAGRLSSLGAQLMESTFENPTSDLSITFAYDYIVKTQAYKAEVLINMDRIQEVSDCALQTYDKTKTRSTRVDVKGGIIGALTLGPIGSVFFGLKNDTKTRISEKDLREAYDTLINLGAVQIQIDQNLPDADLSVIEGSLMNMVMESFTSMQSAVATNQEVAARQAINESDIDKETLRQRERNRRSADNYEVYTLKRKNTRMTGVQKMTITKGVALYRTHSMTGNLGGILREHKAEIFDEVLLNDPFFKRGEITVDLDTEALELFEANMVNNATVEVIVPFPGNAFNDQDVFTRDDISSGGIMKKFTFATRGEDMTSRSCVYKYIETWSLRGGGKWPQTPREQCAREIAVTLVPPIEARRIDVEADLSEMDELGIRAADVLLRHRRYGREEVETANFRVIKAEPYLEKTIFVDKDKPQVEYKIILTHKSKGKFSSDWENLDDDFVYANLSGLPLNKLEEIRQQIPEVQELIDELRAAVD